jgi:hypothetical protein
MRQACIGVLAACHAAGVVDVLADAAAVTAWAASNGLTARASRGQA